MPTIATKSLQSFQACDPYSIGNEMIKNDDQKIAMRAKEQKRKEKGREWKERDTARKELIVMLPLDLCAPPLSPSPRVKCMSPE